MDIVDICQVIDWSRERPRLRVVTPGVHPAQVEGQTDHVVPDEVYAESRVGGQVDHGDAHEHAAHVGDQPGCPHGDANHGRSIPSSLRELPDEIRSHFRW